MSSDKDSLLLGSNPGPRSHSGGDRAIAHRSAAQTPLLDPKPPRFFVTEQHPTSPVRHSTNTLFPLLLLYAKAPRTTPGAPIQLLPLLNTSPISMSSSIPVSPWFVPTIHSQTVQYWGRGFFACASIIPILCSNKHVHSPVNSSFEQSSCFPKLLISKSFCACSKHQLSSLPPSHPQHCCTISETAPRSNHFSFAHCAHEGEGIHPCLCNNSSMDILLTALI